jgi:polyphosphate glucokinase
VATPHSTAPPAAETPEEPPPNEVAVGIDFGGSSIKGGAVDLATGRLVGTQVQIATPQPSSPDSIAEAVTQLLSEVALPDAAVGIAVPGVVRNGTVLTAANIDPSWVGVHAEDLLSDATGRPVRVVNDADAAGLAEVRYGAARHREGLVIVTTLGTGIGSALVFNGQLVPNSELGHLEIDGRNAESHAASSVKVLENLSYGDWAHRLTRYYATLERLFSPDLFVVGGAVSRDSGEFLHLIQIETEIVGAGLLGLAGIVGAAAWSIDTQPRTTPAHHPSDAQPPSGVLAAQ